MTTESLMRELETGTEESVVQLLAGASEKERKAASGAVIERLERALQPWVNQGLTPAQARRIIFQFAGVGKRVDFRPQLALIGTGTFGEVKRFGVATPAQAFDVLAARKPKWLGDWCKWALGASASSWPAVRRLVREGICERPEIDEYYLHMLNGGMAGLGGARQLLESDPALMDHEVWEIFRREGRREASLAQDYVGWSDALVALSAEGRISRERLLDASLEALELPFKPHNTTWYRNFHEALKPSSDERAARLPLYLALASSSVPATMKFAMKAIDAVAKAGALPVDQFLEAAIPALTGKEKGTAAAVLQLLRRALAIAPASRGRVLETAAAALEHPAADIQSAALALIEESGAAEPELKALVASKLELASAQVRERARRWAGAGGGGMGGGGAVAAAAAVLCEVERYAAGATARPDPLERERAIRPIEEVEELVLAMTRVLNQSGPTDELERVLDGVSRLCAERPRRFDDLTSPLRAETVKMFASGFLPQFSGVFSVPGCIAQLAAAWLTDKLAIKLDPSDGYLLHSALGVRPYWVAFRAKRRIARPLLSAPTHTGGWIDPVTLVERLAREAGAADEREFEADLIQALYRLAPGKQRRGEALEAAGGLQGQTGAALRHALGAAAVIPWNASAPLWQAAGRVAEGRSVATASLQWRKDQYNPEILRASMLVEPAAARDVLQLADLPLAETQPLRSVAGLRVVLQFTEADPLLRAGSLGADLLSWAAQMAPGDREAWCALGAFRLANNLDFATAVWTNREFLRVFEEPYWEAGPSAHLLLALGLMAREATEFDLARDGFIGWIGDGRLNCRLLGSTLAELFAAGVVRGLRLARAFTETARVSGKHADAVRQVTEQALAAGLPARPADQSALLEAFLEACTASGAGPSSVELRRLLEAVSGSGKGPKLARSLLALQMS